ncbi:MAG: AraC family transcriptional regulator [Caldilineaceae bacterium]
MVPSPSPSLCSFADIDPYTFGPPSVPLHPPPPRLPEDVLTCGGRQSSTSFFSFEAPAFVEDLLAIHLRLPVRMSVKLERWVHVDSAPGDFTLIPCGAASAWSHEGVPEALLVVLPPTLTRKIAWQDADSDPARVEFLPRVGIPIRWPMPWARRSWANCKPVGCWGCSTWNRSSARSPFTSCATMPLLPGAGAGQRQLPAAALRRVRDYVHAHLDSKLTLEALAALVHLSPYHFARHFKAATGLPPYQYVLQCRVEQAKTLLLTGEHSISEVAQAVGFAGQSHLTRHIKRAYGVAPGAFLPLRKNRQRPRKNGQDNAVPVC